MAARQLSVLLVSSDRKTLRHTGKLLSVFGYQVSCVTELAAARQLLGADRPDIAVLDGSADMEGALELSAELSQDACEKYLFKALLVREPTPSDVAKALDAGVDELLAYPVEHGELLSRLRTAARVLEYERRVESCFGGSASDEGVGSTRFLRELKSQLDGMRAKPELVACVAIEIDHFSKLQTLHGLETTAAAAGAALQVVRESSHDKVLSRLEKHRFAVAFRSSIDQAVTWANDLRERIASTVTGGDEKVSFTVSCGVSVRKSDAISANDLLAAACASVDKARQSGGNFVAREDEFSEEEKCWTELAKTGALFEHTVARNIMVPCTATLKVDDAIAWATETFERTSLRALVVVDEEGKLAGLVTAQSLQLRVAAENCSEKAVSTLMSREVVSFDEQTTLAALIEYFTQESPLVIVIVNKGRPTGMVTPSSLATLSEQLTTESFSATSPARGRADFVVPNLCGVDGA